MVADRKEKELIRGADDLATLERRADLLALREGVNVVYRTDAREPHRVTLEDAVSRLDVRIADIETRMASDQRQLVELQVLKRRHAPQE